MKQNKDIIIGKILCSMKELTIMHNIALVLYRMKHNVIIKKKNRYIITNIYRKQIRYNGKTVYSK